MIDKGSEGPVAQGRPGISLGAWGIEGRGGCIASRTSMEYKSGAWHGEYGEHGLRGHGIDGHSSERDAEMRCDISIPFHPSHTLATHLSTAAMLLSPARALLALVLAATAVAALTGQERCNQVSLAEDFIAHEQCVLLGL